MHAIDYIMLAVAVILLLSVLGSKASNWLGIPALLIFLGLGMLAGSDGPGGIEFSDAHLTQSIGVVALVFILFAGGLDTAWDDVRNVARNALALSTIGVLFTALLVGFFAYAVLHVSLLEGLLLGAIVSSTDAAAVFSVLRSKNVGLKSPIKPLLEVESGSNDPMSVFLTTSLIGLLLNPGAPVYWLFISFVWQMAIGGLLGYAFGRLTVLIVNNVRLGYEGLYPALTIALLFLTYSATALVGGNGFLAVYAAGLVLGNTRFIHKESLSRFHDGLAWLMQIAMFLVLGLLVFPHELLPIMGVGLLVALFLVFVARPISVFLSLAFSKLHGREKTMVSWVGLRGAVPIVLATFPLLSGLPRAGMIFNLVFFIVITSVLLQGTTLGLVARWLKVDEELTEKHKLPIELIKREGETLTSELIEVPIPSGSRADGKQIVELGLPKGTLVVLVERDHKFTIPTGSTVLQESDIMLLLSDHDSISLVKDLVSRTVPSNS